MDTAAFAFLVKSMLQNAQIERFRGYCFVATEDELGCTPDSIRILDNDSGKLYDNDTALGCEDSVTIQFPDKAERYLGIWWSPSDDGKEKPDWHVVTFESWRTGRVIILRFNEIKHQYCFINDIIYFGIRPQAFSGIPYAGLFRESWTFS